MDLALAGVKSFLVSKMEAALTTIEGAYSVTVPRLAVVATEDLKDHVYPALEILPESTDANYRDDEGPLDFEAWDVHSVILLFSNDGQDPHETQFTLLYYRKAVMRIVRADNSFGGLFNRVRMGQSQFWPMVQSQESGRLLQVLRQGLQVRVLQR